VCFPTKKVPSNAAPIYSNAASKPRLGSEVFYTKLSILPGAPTSVSAAPIVSSPSRKPTLSSAHYAANSTTSEVYPKAAFIRTMADGAEALEKGLEQAAQLPPLPVDSWEWSENDAFIRTMADGAEALEKGLDQAAQLPPLPVDGWEWSENDGSSIATADMVCESSDDDLCH
jgi:hypothetical protein